MKARKQINVIEVFLSGLTEFKSALISAYCLNEGINRDYQNQEINSLAH